MPSDNIKHREAIVTAEFENWFKQEYNYIQFYEDVDTSGGDPFDSAGVIGNELFLIEFKCNISKSMVYYENSKGSSIEKKIGQVLDQLYQQRNSNIYNSVSTFYSDSTIPNLIIVAENISKNALKHLAEMLERRSQEWRFNYSVIQWANGSANYLLDKKHDSFKKTNPNHSIQIPKFPSTSPKRNPRLNDEKARNWLNTIGKLDDYNLFLKYASSIGASVIYNVNSVNIILAGKAIFGIWPFKSTAEDGLRMTFELNRIQKLTNGKITSFEDLEIQRSEQKLGFLGYNGYVKNKMEMKHLIDRLETRVEI
jgi:hypothetical protein